MNQLWTRAIFCSLGTSFLVMGSSAATLEPQGRVATQAQDLWIDGYYQIGRASCRERV